MKLTASRANTAGSRDLICGNTISAGNEPQGRGAAPLPGCYRPATLRPPGASTLQDMVVISRWSAEDRPPSRVAVGRELLTVWAVHVNRSYHLIRGNARKSVA